MSLASIYNTGAGSDGGGASARLLSARAGAMNVTQNMIPRSGYAAPLVSGLLGAQAGEQEQQSKDEKKMSDFLSTFAKLSRVSKLMAVKFFNENGPEVGIDTPIDGVDATPDVTTAHFENGNVVGLGMDGIYMPGPDGKWAPATPDFLKKLTTDSATKKKSGGSGGEKQSTVINAYAGINQKIASATNNMAGQTAAQKQQTQSVIDDLSRQKKNMERLYPYLVDQNAEIAPVAPAATPPTTAPSPAQPSALDSILQRIKGKATLSGQEDQRFIQ